MGVHWLGGNKGLSERCEGRRNETQSNQTECNSGMFWTGKLCSMYQGQTTRTGTEVGLWKADISHQSINRSINQSNHTCADDFTAASNSCTDDWKCFILSIVLVTTEL
jgi:hypothetical protein